MQIRPTLTKCNTLRSVFQYAHEWMALRTLGRKLQTSFGFTTFIRAEMRVLILVLRAHFFPIKHVSGTIDITKGRRIQALFMHCIDISEAITYVLPHHDPSRRC